MSFDLRHLFRRPHPSGIPDHSPQASPAAPSPAHQPAVAPIPGAMTAKDLRRLLPPEFIRPAGPPDDTLVLLPLPPSSHLPLRLSAVYHACPALFQRPVTTADDRDLLPAPLPVHLPLAPSAPKIPATSRETPDVPGFAELGPPRRATELCLPPPQSPDRNAPIPAVPATPAAPPALPVTLQCQPVPADRTQLALQALFMCRGPVTPAMTAAHCASLPGILSCLLLNGHDIAAEAPATSPAFPRFRKAAPAAAAALRSLSNAMDLNGAGTFTVQSANLSRSFFIENDWCLAVEHSSPQLADGIREKLTMTVRALAGAS